MYHSIGNFFTSTLLNSPVLVKLELCDDHVGRVNGQGNRGTVCLLTDNSLDVDDPLLTVDLGDTALTTLVSTSDDENLVILVDRDRSDLHDRVSKCREQDATLSAEIFTGGCPPNLEQIIRLGLQSGLVTRVPCPVADMCPRQAVPLTLRSRQLLRSQQPHVLRPRIFAKCHETHSVLLSQWLGERGRHDLPSQVRRGGEVNLALNTAA